MDTDSDTHSFHVIEDNNSCNCLVVLFSLISIKITVTWRAFLQLPAKCPQLPALLIGQIETLILRIRVGGTN